MLDTTNVYLRDSLTYMRHVAIHMIDYVDATTINVLSPDILPLADLRNMLKQIESELPPTMHIPISSDNTLHFLLISLPTCTDSGRTVPAAHQCAHTKQSTTSSNI